jgi:hypothetical protein
MLGLRRNNLRYAIVKPMSRDSKQRGKCVSTSCFFVMAGLFASPACGSLAGEADALNGARRVGALTTRIEFSLGTPTRPSPAKSGRGRSKSP